VISGEGGRAVRVGVAYAALRAWDIAVFRRACRFDAVDTTSMISQGDSATDAAPVAVIRLTPIAGGGTIVPVHSAAPAARHRSVELSERTIRAVARGRGPKSPPTWLFLRRLFNELVLRRLRRINFRRTHNDEAVAAYCAMEGEEFGAINALQAWSSWRTIPRNLAGRLPDRPVTAIDLCSGVGESTAVLAYYCPPGSHVLGLEYNPRFVERARSQTFCDRTGGAANVQFRAQSVLEAFRDASGDRIPDQSVDLVNACGAIGCHFDREELDRLARECARVVREAGLATLDTDPNGAGRDELAEVFGRHGFELVHEARSCMLDRRPQVCLRRVGHP